ncbi:50S ribosomal protein L22 [Candidatus Kaiserbacteria bacterium]|nr:50S ribosomal protein L22 [Candidatus Kaiserbacteria bacterium]
MRMKASLSNFRQSPQKVRLVANAIRGKKVAVARRALSFLPKKSSPMFQKLLDSAVANAKGMDVNTDELIIKSVSVDKGLVIRRYKPMARGRAAGVRKTRSMVSIVLGLPEDPKRK